MDNGFPVNGAAHHNVRKIAKPYQAMAGDMNDALDIDSILKIY